MTDLAGGGPQTPVARQPETTRGSAARLQLEGHRVAEQAAIEGLTHLIRRMNHKVDTRGRTRPAHQFDERPRVADVGREHHIRDETRIALRTVRSHPITARQEHVPAHRALGDEVIECAGDGGPCRVLQMLPPQVVRIGGGSPAYVVAASATCAGMSSGVSTEARMRLMGLAPGGGFASGDRSQAARRPRAPLREPETPAAGPNRPVE